MYINFLYPIILSQYFLYCGNEQFRSIWFCPQWIKIITIIRREFNFRKNKYSILILIKFSTDTIGKRLLLKPGQNKECKTTTQITNPKSNFISAKVDTKLIRRYKHRGWLRTYHLQLINHNFELFRVHYNITWIR